MLPLPSLASPAAASCIASSSNAGSVSVPEPSGATSQRTPRAARPGCGTTIQVPGPAVRMPVPSQRAAVPGGTKKPTRLSPKSASTGPG